jgi:ABC-type antimicrobial peptide transport system permease subunit
MNRVDIRIVGVASDARDQGVRNGPQETVYMSVKQGPPSALTLLTRAEGDARNLISSLLRIVESIDRRIPVGSVHTLDVDVEAGLAPERILGFLSTLFAALATLLAGIGLYGVHSYSIARRRREIGIRFAIGAQKSEVVGLFARETAVLMLAGVALGAPLALLSARALRSLLFGVTEADPVALFISLAVLAAAALLATLIPLWQAVGVEPVSAFRSE